MPPDRLKRIAFAVPDQESLMEVLKHCQICPAVETANQPAQRTFIEPAWKVLE